jgi:hypothetical protein
MIFAMMLFPGTNRRYAWNTYEELDEINPPSFVATSSWLSF